MSAAVYEAVTARIAEALERGVPPWRKPWDAARAIPVNAVSNRAYGGVNAFLLGAGLFRDHRWLSFRQAQDLGGQVRRGERAMIAVFWKKLQVPSTDDSATKPRTVPLLRYYHVFNVEQCDGLSLPPLPVPQSESPLLRIERAEAVIRGIPSPPVIREGGDQAWYRPSEDLIQIPRPTSFHSSDAFYATLFHELGHSTGHEKRLNRQGVSGTTQFGSETYSREELVAELTSAFCCARCGLDNSTQGDAARYISGWLRFIKGDPRALVVAASQAQKATDFLCDTSSGGD